MSNSKRNAKAIDKLMKIAKTTEESVFQRNKDYLKFKSQKNIKITEIDYFITTFYFLNYPEESIYWNKRILEEKIMLKGETLNTTPIMYQVFRNQMAKIYQSK